MHSPLKKLLINTLVLMVVLLSFRSVLAMPVVMTSGHCEEMLVQHAGHDMSAMDMQPTQQTEKVSSCTCCDQCGGDCSGCVHISSAITVSFLELSDIRMTEQVSVPGDFLLTRTLSPPSRPPLIL